MVVIVGLFTLFVVAAILIVLYFTQTKQGREQNMSENLSEAQSVSSMADTAIATNEVQAATAAKLAKSSTVK